MKSRKESGDEGDDEGDGDEPFEITVDGQTDIVKKRKISLIPVWATWTQTWKFIRGPCRVVEIRGQLHDDGVAVDVYAYANDDPPDPDPLDSPLPGFLLVLPGDRLRATLARGAPARLNLSQLNPERIELSVKSDSSDNDYHDTYREPPKEDTPQTCLDGTVGNPRVENCKTDMIDYTTEQLDMIDFGIGQTDDVPGQNPLMMMHQKEHNPTQCSCMRNIARSLNHLCGGLWR